VAANAVAALNKGVAASARIRPRWHEVGTTELLYYKVLLSSAVEVVDAGVFLPRYVANDPTNLFGAPTSARRMIEAANRIIRRRHAFILRMDASIRSSSARFRDNMQ
jgi:hypothetical protein